MSDALFDVVSFVGHWARFFSGDEATRERARRASSEARSVLTSAETTGSRRAIRRKTKNEIETKRVGDDCRRLTERMTRARLASRARISACAFARDRDEGG